MNRIFTILLVFLALPAVALAQSGQLRGTITDQETGEPLLGANVLVVGTTQGAATDLNGEYIILNLFADTYELRSTYIGYQAKTIQNVRVVAGLTSEINFQLAAEGIQVGEVVITAERPLVNKYNTNANRIMTSDDLEALPVRNVDDLYAFAPGVVVQNNAVHIRGGRQDEVGYYLEGTNITDPVVGGRQVTLVRDALEEIQIQSGGYTAEFGGANAGIIKQQIKTGTSTLKASFEYITDNIGFQSGDDAFSGDKTLGAYWYGYSEIIATISAPLGSPNIKFFGLFNSNFIRDQNPQALDGIDLGRIGDASTGDTLDFFYPAGATLNNSAEFYTGTGSITFNFNPFIARVVGTYTSGKLDNPWPATRNLWQINSTIAG
ncbi:MAG: TonB-dependent receptor, partial [Ignavibacteria bacterium]|nr:TonB-dependent receptor [Ignavibacteria bacterium]